MMENGDNNSSTESNALEMIQRETDHGGLSSKDKKRMPRGGNKRKRNEKIDSETIKDHSLDSFSVVAEDRGKRRKLQAGEEGEGNEDNVSILSNGGVNKESGQKTNSNDNDGYRNITMEEAREERWAGKETEEVFDGTKLSHFSDDAGAGEGNMRNDHFSSSRFPNAKAVIIPKKNEGVTNVGKEEGGGGEEGDGKESIDPSNDKEEEEEEEEGEESDETLNAFLQSVSPNYRAKFESLCKEMKEAVVPFEEKLDACVLALLAKVILLCSQPAKTKNGNQKSTTFTLDSLLAGDPQLPPFFIENRPLILQKLENAVEAAISNCAFSFKVTLNGVTLKTTDSVTLVMCPMPVKENNNNKR